MNSAKDEPVIRRILVALDASSQSLAAVEAAAELAAGIQAELLGLFVEDANLFRLAGLPFTRAVDSLSGALRQVDNRQIERQLRAQANRARQTLESAAQRSQVRWSFRVTRGMVSSEVMAAASEADLIVLGKSGWAPGARGHLGSTARTVLTQAPCLALALRAGGCVNRPVRVLYDESKAAGRALRVAVQLVRDSDAPLTVLVMAEDEISAEKLRTEAVERLEAQRVKAAFRTLAGIEATALTEAIRADGGGMLMLPAGNSLLEDASLQAVLNRMDCPVLVVP